MKTLLQRKVGMISGYAYGEEYDAFAEQNKGKAFFFMTGDGALDKNIQKLTAGRIDTLLENKLVLAAKAQQMGVSDQLQMAGSFSEAFPIYMACSPNSDKTQGFIDMANAALPAMKADGSLQKILANYGLQPWW
ncbi:hypothetical protein CHH28_10790 [Bacterioplanes sanyensis]|uniref:Uncharacterized protein n=1 Tax=Bacterioplanes sanyensis TaxID=1249553 RepID=A0A222FJB5_9GAMM|nr:transporter substrate-binding domain-containing protein [Bacterioplanes sanyensis]ASP39137.1 hypothetical protein CHH28_10790 [Bacterioplanes sanyensis]